VQAGLTSQVIQERLQVTDDWNTVASLVLIRIYTSLGDYAAAERQAAAALAAPDPAESVKAVLVPGARALAMYELGHLAESEKSARIADSGAERLEFTQHFFAVDHLRALAGLATERRDFDAAESLIERVLSITERRRPVFEFLALLDRARIWAARGQVRDALTSIEAARQVASQASVVLLAQADELEALLRLSLGDLRSPPELAQHLVAPRRSLLLARVALAAGDQQAALALLQEARQSELTPRQDLVHRLLLTALAIERGDPSASGMLGGVLHAARRTGFLNTVITTAPQLAEYVVEHAAGLRSDPFTDQLVAAAIELRSSQLRRVASGPVLAEPLTAAERRILTLLPTSTYLQIADTLRISHNTVKTHLRSIYQKLGVTSRAEALRRAVDLGLL
jgi:LuxR family transcriptional regulator, maltose regulon positive regulatory protein